MLAANYTTTSPQIMTIPLTELFNPIYTVPTLLFVADNASPCVAEALMHCLVANDMRCTGRDRMASTRYLHDLIDLRGRLSEHSAFQS